MNIKYQEICNTVRADLERVNKNLSFNFGLRPELDKEIESFINAPSKRIRSLVTILYLRASKMYLLPAHYELLAAVELIHNASLIHDDVIDDGKLRRGRKTLNYKFDNRLAVVCGDYLLGEALKKLVKIGSISVIDTFADNVKIMCMGEVNQYFSRYKKTDIEKYIEKSSQKTSSLFESALKAAIILAGNEVDEKVLEFASNFGLAFQIRDDLENVKNIDNTKSASDFDEGIYNAPFILSDTLEEGIEKTKDLINNYVNCAKQCIYDLEKSVYKESLTGLLELLENV